MNDGDVVLLENVRFNPEETLRTPTNAPLTPRRSPPSARPSFPMASAWSTALRLQLRRCRRSAGRRWPAGREGSQGLVQGHREPGASVHRGAWRFQGLRQARRHREPARQGQPSGHRRWHGVHLPQGQGYEVGTSLLEEDQLEKVKGYIETAEKNGVELVLRPTSS